MEKKSINEDRTNQLGINNVDTMYCMHMYAWPTTIDKKGHCYSQCICFATTTDFQTGNIMSAAATADKCLKKTKIN